MESALSRPSGWAAEPKDFHWLEKNIPCQFACPARTDIPAYLAAIARGDFNAAYGINLEANVFPGVLGRVCARPCEPACRHGWEGLGEPVAICFSKRAAADVQSLENPAANLPRLGKTGRRIAVIGAGVAGLAAGRELARWGHAVTVFEQHARPGGMLRQGIPAFRLPRDVVDREIGQVAACGVEIRCGVRVGRDIAFDTLAAGFDAVVVAAGTLKPNLLGLPGGDLRGVEHGLTFLLEVNERDRREIGRRAVVIGGGFTAIDCARVAWRLGATRTGVYYRRSRAEMRVTPGELEEMEREGIPIEFMARPTAFLGSRGRVERVRFVRTERGPPGSDGRARPVDIPGSAFEIEADTVLLATGQAPDASWLPPGPRDGKVFLAGDFATGATTLIDAIGHAKRIARGVDSFLTGSDRFADRVVIEDGRDTARARADDLLPRLPMPDLPLGQRHLDSEVETGLWTGPAREEARRCYLCHFKYEIDMTKCIYCDQCVEVKPRPRCIVKAERILKDAEGRVTGWKDRSPSLEPGAPPFEYYINQEDCIRCNACLEVCPAKCICVQKVSLATVGQP